MDRMQQLSFCKICKNKKRDFQQGLLCGLTNAPAVFENKCDNFVLDKDAVRETQRRESIIDDLYQNREDYKRLPPKILEQYKSQQNISAAIIVGVISAVISAFIISFIPHIFFFQYIIDGSIIGLLCGFSVRLFGKGIDKIYGIIGGMASFLSAVIVYLKFDDNLTNTLFVLYIILIICVISIPISYKLSFRKIRVDLINIDEVKSQY